MKYVISVRDLRAVVSRRVDLGANSWTYDAALNWEELEEQAIAEVEAFGGALNVSALYPCSSELAARAQWGD